MLEKITHILRYYKGDNSLVVTKNASFEQLGLDSLDLVQLMIDIEEVFGITIETDIPIKKVSDMIELIKQAYLYD